MRLAILLLAAGGSTRMGRPKALLPFMGSTLIQNRLETLGWVKAIHRTVVLGSHFEEISPLCQDPKWEIFHHANWSEGMGSSIAAGVNHLLSCTSPSHILIALLDQPYVESYQFAILSGITRYHYDHAIAAEYKGIIGAPAVFPTYFFPDLQALQGDQGARTILVQKRAWVTCIPIPQAAKDWDTPEDIPEADKF